MVLQCEEGQSELADTKRQSSWENEWAEVCIKEAETRGSQKEGHGDPCEVLELELWMDSHSFDSSLKNPNC